MPPLYKSDDSGRMLDLPLSINHALASDRIGDSLLQQDDASSGVRLPALIRDLQIDYTALRLVVPEKVRFRYKLEGFDRDWQDVGNRRQAFYTNLPPRKYRFRVAACALLSIQEIPRLHQDAMFC